VTVAVFDQFLSLLSISEPLDERILREEHIPTFIDAVKDRDLLVTNGYGTGNISTFYTLRPLEVLLLKAISTRAASSALAKCAQLFTNVLLSEEQLNKIDSAGTGAQKYHVMLADGLLELLQFVRTFVQRQLSDAPSTTQK